jgi:hypothetical protein
MATARMPQPTADDPVKVDPKHYKVEFENDRVRVLRIRYGAGEKSVMHRPPGIHCRLPDGCPWQVHLPGRQDGGHQRESRDGAAHGCPYAPARKPQQEAIRSHCCGVEALGSSSSMICTRAGLLSLSFY